MRAKETEQSFSHTRPNGSNFSTALKEQGVSYRGSGENIAWGQKTPEDVMKAWMNSEGHRANILNGQVHQDRCGILSECQGHKLLDTVIYLLIREKKEVWRHKFQISFL